MMTGLYHPLGTFTDHVVLPIGTALFFYGLIKEKTFIRSFLSTPLMILLGRSSYVFYLIHIGFISFFLSPYIEEFVASLLLWLNTHNFNWLSSITDSRGIIYIAIMFTLINVISIIIFKMIEEPLNKAIRSRFKRRNLAKKMEINV